MDNVQPGQNIGPYRILNQVGQGGMATVYRAYHSAMDRYVAIKILPGKLAESPEFTGRFRQEARTIARLEHAHILPVHDYGEADGYTYLIMRYLEAGTLKDRLMAGPLPLREADRLFTQLADALDYAHTQGVIHRDLKPSNVLLDARSNVFLTDFGIAKLLQGDANFTSTGALIGTPAYMSPEQAQGLPVDQRSDIYSLGIILYEMVTGRVPFEADTPLAVILKHLNEPLPLPSSVKPGLAAGIEKVLLKVLAKHPVDRYATTAEFVDAWRQALAEASTATSAAGTQIAAAPPVVPPAPPAPAAVSSQPASTGTSLPAQPVNPVTPLPVPPAAPAKPSARGGRGLLGPLGLVGGLAVLLCGGSLCAVLAYNQFFRPGAPTEVAAGQTTEPGSTGATDPTNEANLPLGTLLAPGDTTAEPQATDEPPPGLEGTWTSWTAVNSPFAVAYVENRLLTGGPGGVAAWDPATGAVTERFTTGEGLPGVYVTSLVSDPDNEAFYIGTDAGLVELVGDQTLIHNSDTGLDSYFIGAVAVTSEGLLVGTGYSDRDGGGLQRRVGENEWEPVGDFPSVNDTDAHPGHLSNFVNVLLADEDNGELWVGTTNGLGRYDGSEWVRFGMDEGLQDEDITMLNMIDGTLYVGTHGGLATFNGDSFEAVPDVTLAPVYGAVLADSSGDLWVSGGGGVARRNTGGEWEMWDYLALTVYSIYGAVEGDNGAMYFGTENGVLRFEGDDFTLWTAPNVPQSAAFGRVLQAPSADQLWFVEEYGSVIDLFDPAAEAWSPGPEYDCDSCVPMGWDADGRLWAGSPDGLWIFDGAAVPEFYDAEAGLPGSEVNAVAFDEKGTAWVGTDGGLALYDNGSFPVTYDTSNSGLTVEAVYKLLPASDGSLWVATEVNLSRLLPDGNWVTYGEGDPFNYEVTVSDLAEDSAGDIWLTTYGDGLFRYRTAEDAWDRYAPEVDGVDLITTEFNSIATGPDGTVWAGAHFGGFARFDGDSWQTFADLNGLIHTNVNDIFVDQNGVVWFATSGGASRYVP